MGVAQTPPRGQSLLDLNAPQSLAHLRPTAPDQVAVAGASGAPGVVVTCRPGPADFAGVSVTPEHGPWDLSAYGHIEARVANTAATASRVCLRVDNEDDLASGQFNAELLTLEPGAVGTVRVRFGYSLGGPGFALDAGRVTRVALLLGKADQEQSVRLEFLVAGGVPDESRVRIRPPDGWLFGPGAAMDATRQLTAEGGARADLVVTDGVPSLSLDLPAAAPEASVLLLPAAGRWDLRDWVQVVVHARNEGASPVVPQARLESGGHWGQWVTAPEPLAPGAEGDLVVPFAGDVADLGAVSGSQGFCPGFESDRAGGVAIRASGEGERRLRVDSVRAVVPPPPPRPDWLGQRPPVPGDWTQTLAEDFNGPDLEAAVWSPYFPNLWDQRMHFSAGNVILGDGKVRLRFERKRGHQNDDPAQPETDLATGMVTSQGRWRQRYGYFECRAKLPRAPGLWLCFFLLPDRGPGAERGGLTTTDGGMEFDILEAFTLLGPCRHIIACHWDGYGESHTYAACDRVYAPPDSEGFITAGLLWEPGRATFYANGEPVGQLRNPRVGTVPAYLGLTTHIGGHPNNVLTGEGLPDDFVIDYVRAWQRRDWAEDKQQQPGSR